nr:mutS protein homolog 5-like isoform X1 [Lepeophtheirus salmonis]XP_040577160.1 mutS protein homolog 5-like isoform X1 [Lepeophtheirus salmonis]
MPFLVQIYIKYLPLFFNLTECKSRINNLRFTFEELHPFIDDDHRQLYLASTLNNTLECTIRATGALLKFLESHFKHQSNATLEFTCIKSIESTEVLYMNKMTFEAFKIFEPTTRPSGSSAGKWNRSKEGLSIFGLLNRCKSSLGVKSLCNILRCPLRKYESIIKRQKLIAFFVQSEHYDLVQNLRQHLRSTKNLRGIVRRIANFTASVQDWKNLKKTIDNLLGMSRAIAEYTSECDIFESMSSLISDDIFSVSYFLEKMFDIHESERTYRFVVKSGIDDTLDDKRRKHNGLPDLLTSIAEMEIVDLGDVIEECSIIYLPRIGYMIAVKPVEEDISEEEISAQFSNFDFLFKTNEILHFKSDRCRELDQTFGDTDAEIKQIEFNIIHKLSTLVLSLDETLKSLTDLAGKLDSIISIAMVSKENGWVKPNMTDDNDHEFKIEEGRHPLQEMCVNVFVPNTTSYGKDINIQNLHCYYPILDSSRVCILTGPNGSGKSVYLKQVGTLVYLAHIGSWIPAVKASVPILRRIDTRIKATESISLGLSAFAIDVHQMNSAISSSTKNSLVLIDEFGKGTNDREGESLLVSSLEFFSSLGDYCPFVLVTTHFNTAFDHLYFNPKFKFFTLEYRKEENLVTFFYKLVEGRLSGSSCACEIAASVDIPSDVIERAQFLISNKNPQTFRYPSKWGKKIDFLEKLGKRIMDMDLDKASREDLLFLPDVQ